VRFGVSEGQLAGVIVIHVEGELDLLTAPKLMARLDRVLRAPAGDLVLNLTEAEFIDSVGLQTLMSIQRRLEAADRHLTVVCGEGPVRRQIEITRLITALSVVWSLEEYEQSRREQ
jgi:anti-sigma B factor antagonist